MPNATLDGGLLIPIENCWINIPTYGKLVVNNLPDITDSKSAAYNDEVVMGRSFPLKTFSHSENRSISVTLHFLVLEKNDIAKNLAAMRAIESCVYPRDGNDNTPFQPPPVCELYCGKLLGEKPLCVVLKTYNLKFGVDVVWDEETYLPYKFDIDTTWDVVYRTSSLPGQEKIMKDGN